MVNSSIRKLWPAYSLNVASPQASTEELFQQTRLIAAVDVEFACDLAVRKANQSIDRRETLDIVWGSEYPGAQ